MIVGIYMGRISNAADHVPSLSRHAILFWGYGVIDDGSVFGIWMTPRIARVGRLTGRS